MKASSLIGSAVFAADYASKRFVEKKLPLGVETHPMADGRIAFLYTQNKGTAGSHFAGKKEVIILSGAAVGLSALSYLRTVLTGRSFLSRTGNALILAGGFGNFNDRMMHGCVTDFIRFHTGKKAADRLVFNLADFAIFAGTALAAFGAVADRKKA